MTLSREANLDKFSFSKNLKDQFNTASCCCMTSIDSDNLNILFESYQNHTKYFDYYCPKYKRLMQQIIVLLKHDKIFSNIQIKRLFKVTDNQIKYVVLLSNKNRLLDTVIVESFTRSGLRKIDNKELLNEIDIFIKEHRIIDLKKILLHLKNCNLKTNISYSSLRRIIINNYQARYLSVSKVHEEKNSYENKICRRFVTSKLINHFNVADLVVSIDETSFSSVPKRMKKWITKTAGIYFRLLMDKPHTKFHFNSCRFHSSCRRLLHSRRRNKSYHICRIYITNYNKSYRYRRIYNRPNRIAYG